eukprot:TRINITY_DN66453_c0_g1_i1.p1 TRINITY_DN66453_c0_g1~~TRINITY_DN66453_c0_g1_i1.p1  ORF type:complete len:480 (-),score=78.87 TRINITY_DN66453_c0_g1_i1:217-1458(-)
MSVKMPWLLNGDAPVVCLSDWQYEKTTQKYFWLQALDVLEQKLGTNCLEQALFLCAGDMASSHDWSRGVESDDVPDFKPFTECLGFGSAFHAVYGNHDNEVSERDMLKNSDSSPVILPDGEPVTTAWRFGNGLQIGGVHGIPGKADGWKKRNRKEYFQRLEFLCDRSDVVITHSNPKLPFQTYIDDQDAERMYAAFKQGTAKMLVNGHLQTQEVLTILPSKQVVVNADKRIIVLLPRCMEKSMCLSPAMDSTQDSEKEKEVKKLQKQLRQIEKLEALEAGGDTLDKLQIAKLDKKAEILQKLEALQLDVCAEGQTQNAGHADTPHTGAGGEAPADWEDLADNEELPEKGNFGDEHLGGAHRDQSALREVGKMTSDEQFGQKRSNSQKVEVHAAGRGVDDVASRPRRRWNGKAT